MGIACALAAASIYGLIPNLARLGFDNGVPGVEATLVRTTIIAIVLGGIVRSLTMPKLQTAARRLAKLRHCRRSPRLIVSVSYLWSVQYIPVGLAVIIFFTFPVIILLAAPLVEGHRPGLVRIAIACVAFVGTGHRGRRRDRDDPSGAGSRSRRLRRLGATLQFFSGRAVSRYLPPAVFGSLVHVGDLAIDAAHRLVVGQAAGLRF